MRFLRDQAMQGAGFFVAILVLLLQFPEHLVWLLPLSVLFIGLLYLGHQNSPKTNQTDEISGANWNSIRDKAILFSKNWLTPSITILVIIVSAVFTIRGVSTKARLGLVEKIEFQVTSETRSISLHTIVSNGSMRNILFNLKPEIVFSSDNNGFLITQIKFNNAKVGVEDSGVDPQNIILEPNGDFISAETSFMGDEYYRPFDLKSKHTFFIMLENGGLVRLHVENFPQIPPPYLNADHLILFISYVPSLSQRFDGLTEP